MRSTKASNALARLQSRSGNMRFGMQVAPNGLFSLTEVQDDGEVKSISAAMELDEFVRYVNAQGPQQVKRVSKLDVAFEKQLHKKTE